MSGTSININTQVNISENRAVKVKVNSQVEVQKTVKYENDGYAKPETKKGKIPDNINIIPEEPKTKNQLDDSASKVAKNISKGVLIGGGVGAVANPFISNTLLTNFFPKGGGMIEKTLSNPTSTGIALGVSIGAGIALLNTETSDKKLKVAKNVAGSALLVGGSTGVVQTVAKSIFAGNVQSPSSSGVLLGAAIAGGIALNKADVGEDKTANLIKNTASSVMIVGGATGLVTSFAKTVGTKSFQSSSATMMGLGSSIAAGIALANSDVDSKGLKVAKNTLAGTLIAGGTTGVVTSFAKAIITSSYQSSSATMVGLGASIGAGIALANSDVDSKGLKVAKNALAGTLIAGGAAGIVTAAGKSIGAEMFKSPSLAAIGIAAAVGAGIGIASTKK